MKRIAFLTAILMMACIPSFAQFPQIDGDPIDYSLIRYPRYPGSYPATFEVELSMIAESDFDHYRDILNGKDTFILHYDGELIRTKDISEKMLQNAINWGFNEAGIRDRRHLKQLLDKINAVIPSEVHNLFWQQMGLSGADFAGNLYNELSGKSRGGNAAMALKYMAKIHNAATGRTSYSDEFANSGTLGDAASIALQLGGASAATAELTNGAFFVLGFWETFFDEYTQATTVRPAINAARAAAQMVNKFYASVNRYLLNNSALLKDDKWLVYIKGKAAHPFIYYDEQSVMILSIYGTLEKLWEVNRNESMTEKRFYDTPQGRYFGWLDAVQECHMYEFDKNYILTDKEEVITENSAIKKSAKVLMPSSPMNMRPAANMWSNNALRLSAEGEDVEFKHESRAETETYVEYSIPATMLLRPETSYLRYARALFHTLEGTEEVDGEYTKMEIEEKELSYDHRFTFSAEGLKMEQQEVIQGDKIRLIINGEVIEEQDAAAALISPPSGTMYINRQQSIADGTFNRTK